MHWRCFVRREGIQRSLHQECRLRPRRRRRPGACRVRPVRRLNYRDGLVDAHVVASAGARVAGGTTVGANMEAEERRPISRLRPVA